MYLLICTLYGCMFLGLDCFGFDILIFWSTCVSHCHVRPRIILKQSIAEFDEFNVFKSCSSTLFIDQLNHGTSISMIFTFPFCQPSNYPLWSICVWCLHSLIKGFITLLPLLWHNQSTHMYHICMVLFGPCVILFLFDVHHRDAFLGPHESSANHNLPIHLLLPAEFVGNVCTPSSHFFKYNPLIAKKLIFISRKWIPHVLIFWFPASHLLLFMYLFASTVLHTFSTLLFHCFAIF